MRVPSGGGHFGQNLSPLGSRIGREAVAFDKLTGAVRRNELLLLASVLAGLVMALFEMALTWATGAGLWSFPGFVSATVFRSLQTAGTSVSFSMTQILSGLALHLGVAMVMGGLFAWLSPKLRDALGLDSISETPSYGLLGAGFGLGVFAVAWYGALPYANPVMVEAMDPRFLAMAHAAWGLSLGVTRKAWIQKSPRVSRSSSSSTRPAAAGSAHKAPSGSSGASHSGSGASADIATLDPEEGEDDEFQGWPEPEEPSSEEDEEPSAEPSATANAGSDDLSPWPDPPDEDEDSEGEDAGDNGYTSPSPSPTETSTSSSPSTSTQDDEEGGISMTEHARRSLRGLTDREPDLPPVHRQLNTTLTHVAPGRAVCTIEADDTLHDMTGAVQSGILISLGELAATVAMETVAPDSKHATVSSQIDVEGSVEEGHVVAEAEVTEQAGTTTITEVEVRNAAGETLVRARFQAATGEADD